MSMTNRPTRLRCEALEGRDVPATWTASTPAELVARITEANNTAGDDTIVLVANTTYTLTATNNTQFGPTGLPVVTATLPNSTIPSGSLTIVGNGATIQRSPTAGTPQAVDYFRLIAVAPGATLNVSTLTLQGGRVEGGSNSPARGGAIYNLGTVALNDVIVQNNTAYGYEYLAGGANGGPAQGGGVYSEGSIRISGGSFKNNAAIGGRGASLSGRDDGHGRSGGSGLGGGVYIAGGSADLTGVALTDNVARGGDGGAGQSSSGRPSNGGNGGSGRGGAVHAAGGITTLTRCTVQSNDAIGGAGGKKGFSGTNGDKGAAEGGGIYVGPGVTTDWDTATTIKRNTATIGKDVFRA